MTYVLGINAYHGDSAACLLRDGEIVAAVEEERFTRIKHWAGSLRHQLHSACSGRAFRCATSRALRSTKIVAR